MVKYLTRARFVSLLAAVVVTAACGADTPTESLALQDSGPISVRVRNAGTTTLTNVSVLVADNTSPITLSELRPGQTTDYVARAQAHENPAVTAKANGFDYSSQPVEGFAGFNPVLADGRYTVTLETIVVESQKALYVKVTKDN
jgi:hypothetical protein